MTKPTLLTLFKQSFQDDQAKGSSQRFICYLAFLMLSVVTIVVLASSSVPEQTGTLIYTLGGLAVGGGLSSQIGKIKKQ
jgi:hypothetical protein